MDDGVVSPKAGMRLKVLFKAFSWLISLLCLVYFVAHVRRTGLEVPGQPVLATVAVVLAGAMVYGLSVVLLAVLWVGLVPPSHPPTRNIHTMLAAYLMGQFAKYLPGNVMHYAARHALGAKAGASHSGLAAAALAEIYLLLCTGAALAVFLGGVTLDRFSPRFVQLPPMVAIIPLAAAFVACIPNRLSSRWLWIPNLKPRQVAGAVAGYSVFFLTFGALYWGCLAWTSFTLPQGQDAAGAAIVAWVAGFILPGAPAGAGLREAALSAGTDPGLSSARVSSAIIVFRIVTLGGDLIALVAGQLLCRGGSVHVARDGQRGPTK